MLTIAGTVSKKSRMGIVLIAATMAAVLTVIYFLNKSETDTPMFGQEAQTEVNQIAPSLPMDSLTQLSIPPDLWLQASGSASGNAAWGYPIVAPFDTLWNLSTGRELFSPPAFVGDYVFIAGNDKVLRALNRDSGQQLWSRTVTCGLSGGVAADSSAVYFSGQDGYMYALDSETGSEKWKTGLGYHIFTDACIFGDTLVLAGNSMGSIAALDKRTGALIWDDTMDGLLLGPAITDSIAVFSSEAGVAGAWDISGNTLWSRGFTSQPSSPSIVSNVVFLGFSSGKVLALSLQTGETLWETALSDVNGRTVLSRPAVTDNSLLVAGTCDGRVFCLETVGGELQWETVLDNWITVSPAVCDTIVYASCDDGRIHILSLNTGLAIDTLDTGSYSGTPPALLNGVLYTGNSDGDFTAIAGALPDNPEPAEEE